MTIIAIFATVLVVTIMTGELTERHTYLAYLENLAKDLYLPGKTTDAVFTYFKSFSISVIGPPMCITKCFKMTRSVF